MFGARVKEFQGMFFDRAKVQRAVDAGIRKPLSKAGAFVRQTARGLIRKSKKPSKPGQPPHGHGAQLLKQFIFFGYDDSSRSVVIGPARLNAKEGDAPQVLEFGGTTNVIKRGKIEGTKYISRRPVRIAARPYMGPSLEKNRGKFPSLFADSVKSQ